MVIAMITVWMMQMPINQVVHMVAMRYGFMPTFRSMNMSRFMTTAMVVWRALIGILRIHR